MEGDRTRTPGDRTAAAVASSTTRSRDEAGAVLILALLFLVVIGMLVGGLASWTANNLSNTLVFQKDRTAQNALYSTSQVAIQNIRYTPLLNPNQTLNASPPSYCWGPTPASGQGNVSELTVQGYQVAVWCSTLWNPTSATTRVVTVSACLTLAVPTPPSGSSLASVQAAAAQCAVSPGLKSIVTFDDYSISTGFSQCPLPPPNPSTCGQGMTINQSTIGTVIPTVTSLSSTQGPVTGGGTLTVSGTGFVTGATTVNFVAASTSTNIVLPGVGVTVSSPTSLTVTIPAATTVTSYNVIVTTPSGSSAAGAQDQYTYQPVIPTVTSIATSTGGTSGSAAGGSSVTITGTGFLSSLAGDNTTVNFVNTANSAIVLPAPSQNVNSSTSITATTPGIASGTTYYVVVTTAPGGTSANGPVFTFQPFTPLVASVFATSGTPGTVVTITGVGFVSGSTTVQLIPTSGSGTLTATAVSVSSSTTLTATIPTGGVVNKVYYVQVTTATGGPSGTGGAPQFTWI
jgi:hypothetical protein